MRPCDDARFTDGRASGVMPGGDRLEKLGKEDQMRTRLAALLLPFLAAQALADVPKTAPENPKQPRTLGQKAVLHIYYYAPKTLEITYVDSYLFKDEDSCRDAIGRALQIASPYAGDGDRVSAKCVGVSPPDFEKPDEKRDSPNSTDL
jgi:hypothetical protein